MVRRSPRFKSGIQTLPKELLLDICWQLDLSALASLRRTSRAFREFVDEAVMRDLRKPGRSKEATHPGKQSDGHQVSSLRLQGFTDEELVSFATFLNAMRVRHCGLPFREGNAAAPTLRRQYDFAEPQKRPLRVEDGYGSLHTVRDFGVHCAKIDHIDRVLLTTSAQLGGGLRATCLDSGELLWRDESVEDFARLDFEEGWAATAVQHSSSNHSIQVWCSDRLAHGSHPGASVERGVLRKAATLELSKPTPAIRLHYPHLLALTTDLRLLTFDIRSGDLLSSIDITPATTRLSGESAWFPAHIDFDGEYSFSLLSAQRHCRYTDSTGDRDRTYLQSQWSLQVFPRDGTGRRVSQLDAAGVRAIQDATDTAARLKREVSYDFSSRYDPKASSTQVPYWDRSAKIQVSSSITDRNYVKWPINTEPFGIGIDSKTESLCLLAGRTLTILTDYKEMLSRPKQQCQPITLRFASEILQNPRRTLAVANGMVTFNLDGSIVLVDLETMLSDLGDEGAVSRFRPDALVDFYECIRECSTLYLDRTMLAFQTVGWTRAHDDYSTVVMTLDFAELGRVRDRKPPGSQKRSRLIELPWRG